MFAVPVVLTANPRLLGYYRLLLGYSQKAFYSSTLGTPGFRSMEDRGVLSKTAQENLGQLSQQFCSCGSYLLNHLPGKAVDVQLFRDLALMTLGAQLRGAANVTIGTQGVVSVFDIIKNVVEPNIADSSPNVIALRNAAGRDVLIEFAADPDIVIKEKMPTGGFRNIIAIEIKAGTDYSNIHNRLGEAEKSHINARRLGFSECWSIINVALAPETARQESPSMNRFYLLSDLKSACGEEYSDFRSRIISLTGIADLGKKRPTRMKRKA